MMSCLGAELDIEKRISNGMFTTDPQVTGTIPEQILSCPRPHRNKISLLATEPLSSPSHTHVTTYIRRFALSRRLGCIYARWGLPAV